VALGIMRDMGNRGKIVGGSIKFQGRDMGDMSDEELRDIRGSKIAMIYQEPMASLNPAMKVGKQLMEVPMIHEGASKADAYKRSLDLLDAVKLPDPARVMSAYPHQISGGQQQRIVIAMALLSKPDLLLLDEVNKRTGARDRHIHAFYLAQSGFNSGNLRSHNRYVFR